MKKKQRWEKRKVWMVEGENIRRKRKKYICNVERKRRKD